MSGLSQDIRYAWRALRGTPGIAAVATASLALGIGANIAISSIVNVLMLRPLPVEHSEQPMRPDRVRSR